MKHITSILFLFISLLCFSQTRTYKVLNVTPKTVFIDGKTIFPKQIIELKGEAHYFPSKDFFTKNKLVFKSKAELVLREGRNQFVLNYDDYIGNNKRRISSMNSNCSTRGSNKDSYLCNDSIPNAEFHLLAFSPKSKKICKEDCLKFYFNSGSYWIAENDTLNFCSDIVDTIVFKYNNESIHFERANNQIIIKGEYIPDYGFAEIFFIKDGKKYKIADANIFNISKIIKSYKEENLNDIEIAEIFTNGPFNEFFKDGYENNPIIKNMILDYLIRNIKGTESF